MSSLTRPKILCHCTDCRKIGGSTYSSNSLFPADGFKVTKGTPKQHKKTADGGNEIVSNFWYVHSSVDDHVGLRTDAWGQWRLRIDHVARGSHVPREAHCQGMFVESRGWDKTGLTMTSRLERSMTRVSWTTSKSMPSCMRTPGQSGLVRSRVRRRRMECHERLVRR
jgi:hypothetical protein